MKDAASSLAIFVAVSGMLMLWIGMFQPHEVRDAFQDGMLCLILAILLHNWSKS